MSRALLVALFAAGCATSHAVRPLPKGTGSVTASLGGPISADLPTPVAFVVPLTTLGYAHGVSDRTTVHAAVHPSALAAFGVVMVDAGAAWQLVDHHRARPRLMLDSDLIFATGNLAAGEPEGGTRLFPDLQVVASWDLGPHALYGGVDNFVQLFPTPNYTVSPLVGGLLDVGRTELLLEVMWQAPFQDNDLVAAQFLGPFGQGATAIKLGMNVGLGRRPTKEATP